MTLLTDNYTLIVIDMQTKFYAANKRSTIAECKNLILRTKQDYQPIVFVEYVGFGQTNKGLFKLCDNYRRFYSLRKSDDDGSLEIKSLLKGFSLPSHRLKICGVNTDACVFRTVYGLRKILPNTSFEVYSAACATEYNHERGIASLKEIKNVSIIV